MKLWCTNLWLQVFPLFIYRKAIMLLTLGVTIIYSANAQQELVFKNGQLQSGSAGADGGVYRFSNVTTNVDALVKINGRSSALVTLENLDITNTGYNKAFQPQVTYNGGSIQGAASWWMEFQVSFVEANTTNPITVSGFDVTAIDVDGDGNGLNEYVCLYKQHSYITENATLLSAVSVSDLILGQSCNGKKFNGPITNFVDIDTTGTRVMVTNKYQNTSSFTIRTGAKTTGSTNATDRMYSFWFKGFTYLSPLQGALPVTLNYWDAVNNNNVIYLKWSTTVERNASHFVIEKSFDGIEYSDAALIVAAGNSDAIQSYSFNDKIPAGTDGTIYYRLRMVDMDGAYKKSDVKSVRLKAGNMAKIVAYPNPVNNELRIAIPQEWKGKQVTYQLSNLVGKMITTYTVSQAGQTETIKMISLPVGTYVLKVSHGTETAIQTIAKLRN